MHIGESDLMGFKEVEPKATTLLPVGGLIRVGDLVDGESAIFGDEDVRLGATKDYRPLVPDESERVHGRWVAEHTSNGMFEILGSWLSNSDLQQGTLATGASANYLLVTDSHIRGAVPPLGTAQVRTNAGVTKVTAGWVYIFAIALVDIAIIDGNKRDLAIGCKTEGLMVKWARTCDANWNKVRRGGPWHKDNDAFARAVLEATIAAKMKHSSEKVRASAVVVQKADRTRAYSSGSRTTFNFETP
jgi:hypothetical protein